VKEISTIIAYHEVGCKVPLLIPTLHLKRIERTLYVTFWIFVEPDVLRLARWKFEWVGVHVHNNRLHVDYRRVVKLIGLSLNELRMLDRKSSLLLTHLRNLFLYWLLLSFLLLLFWKILILFIRSFNWLFLTNLLWFWHLLFLVFSNYKQIIIIIL